MPRLHLLDHESADSRVASTLKATPINIFKGMANNPDVMQGLLGLSGSLGRSPSLSPREKEAVMLRVSEQNGCDYCLAAHTAVAAKKGVSAEEALAFRRGEGGNDRETALLRFLDAVLSTQGFVDDAELAAFRAAGFDDAAVVEVCAGIAWMTFTNLFNHVNDTEIDFPAVPEVTETVGEAG